MERAYRFGRSTQLVGILTDRTDPAPRSAAYKPPTVLCLNAGLLHHVGPYRLHVELGRDLARLGFPVFRFDLSGIGDSEKHRDSGAREEQAQSDIAEAMDFLAARTHAEKFVVMGLCTGADNAHKISVRDERVVGAVQLDGYVYITTGYLTRRYGPKLLNPIAWWHAAKRRIGSNQGGPDGSHTQDKRVDNYFWTLPPKQKTEAELQSLVNRGVNLLYIFSGGNDAINYKEQFARSFKSVRFGKQLQVEYLSQCEHTYPIIQDRDNLKAIICRWMIAKFPVASTDEEIAPEQPSAAPENQSPSPSTAVASWS